MSKILIGKKIGMTQVFDEDRNLIPVTVVAANPCVVSQIKTSEKDGYNAIQIAANKQKESRLSKAEVQHLQQNNIEPYSRLKEFRVESTSDYKLGDTLNVSLFAEDEKIDTISTTIGRGFQGVVKRWNFAGGPASHGSMFHRRGGSYGQCQWPGEVHKGRKMPGHMGSKSRTTQNLQIVKIIEDENLLLIKGSFPGSKGSEVIIRKAKKIKNKGAL